MAYLTDADFEYLPEDDHEAFASLATISHNRLQETERGNHDDLTWTSVMDYMNEVTALAEQLGIEGIFYDANCDNYHSEYARFSRSVEFRLAQIRVIRARRNLKYTISISGPGREKIQLYLERIKDEISKADIPEKRKRALLDRIADFETELARKRFNMAAAMTVIALVAAATADFSGVLEGAPKFIKEVTNLIAREQVEDDEARERLRVEYEPLKAIPDMRTPSKPSDSQAKKSDAGGFPDDLDDDVPF